jgi:hypothetical protein
MIERAAPPNIPLAADGGYLRRPNGPAKLAWAFSVKFTDEDGAALRRLADSTGVTVGEIIRKSVVPLLQRQK